MFGCEKGEIRELLTHLDEHFVGRYQAVKFQSTMLAAAAAICRVPLIVPNHVSCIFTFGRVGIMVHANGHVGPTGKLSRPMLNGRQGNHDLKDLNHRS